MLGSMNVRMEAFAHERRSRRGWRGLWPVESIDGLRFSETQMDLCEMVIADVDVVDAALLASSIPSTLAVPPVAGPALAVAQGQRRVQGQGI